MPPRKPKAAKVRTVKSAGVGMAAGAGASVLTITFVDAGRNPLDDVVDVTVTSEDSNRTVAQLKNVRGTTTLKVTGLTPLEICRVQVFPMRHRPVGWFARANEAVALPSPVDPERVSRVKFPEYDRLGAKADAILQRSALDEPANLAGKALYDALADVPRAGLLNLLAKMGRTSLPGGTGVMDHVESFYRVRGDRVFANVGNGLRDLVKIAVDEKRFEEVGGSLHNPPPDFRRVDSFKSKDHYGNLQITFFASLTAPLRFKADIDIDDAAGIEHVFQVLSHKLTGDETHPYDIHEILLYHQSLDPLYQLFT